MTIYDGGRVVLTRGTGQLAEDGRTAAFTTVHDPGALLHYYFGPGGRRVTVELGGATLTDWLKTHWDGTTRTWFLEVEEAS